MSILHYLDNIFLRLSVIPGLGFLHDYVHELETQKNRREQMFDTYKGYGRSLREAGEAVRPGGHGHGHGEDDDHSGQKAHGKPVKRGKSARPTAKPGRGGQVARNKVEDPSDLE